MNHPEFSTLPDNALIRLSVLYASGLVPFSTSTLWRKCRSGNFPPAIKVSSNVTGWRVGEVRRWLQDPLAYTTKSNGQTASVHSARAKRSAA
jgi:predicted DNA-binding transcriptional regulator AlpA